MARIAAREFDPSPANAKMLKPIPTISMFPRVHLLCLLVIPISPGVGAQSFGLGEIESKTAPVITESSRSIPTPLRVVHVFPRLDLSLTLSIILVDPMDGSNRLFHVSQFGVIKVFPNIADPSPEQVDTFLDIHERVFEEDEEGMVGLAFDPDFAANGYFYVYYNAGTPENLMSRISRFTAPDPSLNTADPDSELIILELHQPKRDHNGGTLEFGPDGMLYISLGDGGGLGDPDGNAQNLGTLLGSILRIDVSQASTADPYAIPADNPFVGAGPGVREEIYARGLRNPYKISFDRLTGDLYCADVGNDEWEEIDIIVPGGNYGWPVFEGTGCFPATTPSCSLDGHILPIAVYAHVKPNHQRAVIGGYVYDGEAIPELRGVYLFADYVTGEIMGVTHDGQNTTPIVILAETEFTITGFGQDASGEVYLLDYFGGIHALRPANAAEHWRQYE